MNNDGCFHFSSEDVQHAVSLFEHDKTLESYRMLHEKYQHIINDGNKLQEALDHISDDSGKQVMKQIIHDGAVAEFIIKEFDCKEWKLCVEKDKMQSFYKDRGSGMHAVKVQGTIAASMFQVLSIFYEGML